MAGPSAASGRTGQGPAPILHDFGTIRHGTRPSHEFEIPLPDTDGVGLVPLAFQATCTCASHRFLVRGTDGVVREIEQDGVMLDSQALAPGEALLLRVTIDSSRKEAVDAATQIVNGNVVLQEAAAGHARHFVRVQFRFAIDAPFDLKPFSHLDYGDIARPVGLTLPIVIHPDLPESGDDAATLGEPQVVEQIGDLVRSPPDLAVTLQREADGWLLNAAFKAANDRPIGPFVFAILIPTSLQVDGDPYELRIPVSGRVVPSVQLSPPEAFSFGSIPFDAPREQSLIVTDHDSSRAADFVVQAIVDHEGNDAAEHFEASVLPVAQQPRSRRVVLRYLGKLDASTFRGQVLVGKTNDDPEPLHIDFVGFRRRDI